MKFPTLDCDYTKVPPNKWKLSTFNEHYYLPVRLEKKKFRTNTQAAG